jgi:hypothetical protein
MIAQDRPARRLHLEVSQFSVEPVVWLPVQAETVVKPPADRREREESGCDGKTLKTL